MRLHGDARRTRDGDAFVIATQHQPSPAAIDAENAIIDVRGLVKRYGETTAVDGIDLSVQTGEIFGILGPNGAGKTTTLEMIEGLRKPDAGTSTVDGNDAVDDSDRLRRVIAVLLRTTGLDE
jgi:ABC-2 type transport system ATP-binding protein